MKYITGIRIRFKSLLVMPLVVLTTGCSKERTPSLGRGVFVVETDSGYHLLRNGKIFRVKGASVGSGGDVHWETLRKSGGNTIRLYDTVNLQSHLDRAAALGLAVAVDIPLPEHHKYHDLYTDSTWLADTRRKIERLVRRHKEHPALLFWTLGNEVVPRITESNRAMDSYNDLARTVKETDPSHPLTTTMHFSNREILNARINCPYFDFLSINAFGSIREFKKRKNRMRFFWNGPYMLTEWGINGPWEADVFTDWGAPIEQTSTKKAEQYLELYQILHAENDGRILGDFLFYWGQKEESTPTWYSVLLPGKKATQIAVDISKLWSEKPTQYTGPRIDYLLLEGKGGPSSIVLEPGKEVQAALQIAPPIAENLACSWEIRPEHWYRAGSHDPASKQEMPVVPTDFRIAGLGEVSFKAPMEPGPYRLYVYLSDPQGFAATTNIPFFILEHKNGL